LLKGRNSETNQDGSDERYYKTKKDTGCQTTDYGHIHYLDRHRVWCEDDEVLGSVILEKCDHPKEWAIRIKYVCWRGPKIKKGGQWLYTHWNSLSTDLWQSVHYLDRHDINCPANHALGGFHFMIDANRKNAAFQYRCNRVEQDGSGEKYYPKRWWPAYDHKSEIGYDATYREGNLDVLGLWDGRETAFSLQDKKYHSGRLVVIKRFKLETMTKKIRTNIIKSGHSYREWRYVFHFRIPFWAYYIPIERPCNRRSLRPWERRHPGERRC